MTLDELNQMDERAFTTALGGVYEHSPWVAEAVAAGRPFASLDALRRAMAEVVARSGHDRQLALIRAHPELAGKAMVQKSLTSASTSEQSRAGLTQCSPQEFARLTELNARYNARFGFPFILAVKGYDRAGVIAEFERRIGNSLKVERAEALRQVGRIVGLRLGALVEG